MHRLKLLRMTEVRKEKDYPGMSSENRRGTLNRIFQALIADRVQMILSKCAHDNKPGVES